MVRHQWPGFCNTPTGGLEVRLKRGLCQATQVSCLQELTQAVACSCRSLTPFLSQLLPPSLSLPSYLYFIHMYIDKIRDSKFETAFNYRVMMVVNWVLISASLLVGLMMPGGFCLYMGLLLLNVLFSVFPFSSLNGNMG